MLGIVWYSSLFIVINEVWGIVVAWDTLTPGAWRKRMGGQPKVSCKRGGWWLNGSFPKFKRFIYLKMISLKNYLQQALSTCGKDKLWAYRAWKTVPEDFEIDPQKVLLSFKPLTEAAICKLIQSSANKSCALDPTPTPLVVLCLDVLLPVITTIVNSSLLHGHFPSNLEGSNCDSYSEES